MALRIMACMLLLEITAYLRETFQNLPKSIRTMGRDRPAAWEKSYMKDSNRRFSVALSSMGHSQASAQSLQSISCDREPSELHLSIVTFILYYLIHFHVCGLFFFKFLI